MRTIKSKVNARHACPANPAFPQVNLTVGGEFTVTDAMAEYLVSHGDAEYTDIEHQAQPELPLEETPVRRFGRKK